MKKILILITMLAFGVAGYAQTPAEFEGLDQIGQNILQYDSSTGAYGLYVFSSLLSGSPVAVLGAGPNVDCSTPGCSMVQILNKALYYDAATGNYGLAIYDAAGGGGGSTTLDDAYNNFGANPELVTVDSGVLTWDLAAGTDDFHITTATTNFIQFNGDGIIMFGKTAQKVYDSGSGLIMYWSDNSSGTDYNVAFGPLALNNLAAGGNGDDNTAFGYEAGTAVSTGTDNVMVGYQAGFTATSGSYNTLVGTFADVEAFGDEYLVALGYAAYGGTDSVAIGRGAYAPDDGTSLPQLAIVANQHYVSHRTGGSIQTTNDTPTIAISLPLENNTTYHIKAYVIGLQSGGTNRASYEMTGTWYRTGGGGAAGQGGTQYQHVSESNAAWAAQISTALNNVTVLVTGVAATTIDWDVTIEWWSSNDG